MLEQLWFHSKGKGELALRLGVAAGVSSSSHGDVDCCRSMEDREGSDLVNDGMVFAPNQTLTRLAELLRPMFFVGLHPVLWDCWLLNLAS